MASVRVKAIEVLCKQQAYVVKQTSSGERPSSAQVTWSRHGGPVSAWAEAKHRAGLAEEE